MKVDTAFATVPLPGQKESGDLSLVKRVGAGTLVAVVDGLGHGQEAASAAHAAVGALDRYAREPLSDLVRRAHEALVGLRGVVLGLAYLDPQAATMTWLGVGNVEGLLLRAPASRGARTQSLLVRGGVVGSHLPPLAAEVVPLRCGDTLILATDGVRSQFLDATPPYLEPQALADHVLTRWGTQTDDALVLVVRYVGSA